VDRSLWLLMRLRAWATLRRMKKSLSRPKGIAMAVVMVLFFVFWVTSVATASWFAPPPPLEPIRRFAPLGILVFTVGSLLFSAGEQALYYTPAEVTFLFAGPYRKRQLLAYKLVVTVLLCLFSALFLALAGKMISPGPVSAFVGSFLLVLFLQVLQMVVGLAAATLGALAWSRGRRLVLGGVIVLLGLAAASAGRELGGAGWKEALTKIERSPVASTVLAPFRWFVLAFTAERIWPDLVKWSAPGVLIDAGLIGLVFALDARYLEAASASSGRRFARLQRMGGGGGVRSVATRRAGLLRFRPPAAPWWGGVGPNLWRQMTTALGDPARMVGAVGILTIVPVLMMVMIPRNAPNAQPVPYVCMGMIAYLSILLSFLLPYDFRGDVDLMEELKTLPIAPSRLALGQVLTPTLVATAAQAIAMAVVMLGLGGLGVVAWSILAFLLPVNLVFYAIENLLFLWYPSRIVAGQFDVMAIGRQMLFLLAKGLGLGLASGLATLAGGAAYFATGGSLGAGLVVAWVAISACALAMVPLVGQAFARFDVARDVPA